MARKDTSKAVLSMLSTTGAQTRPTVQDESPQPASGPVPRGVAPPPLEPPAALAPLGEPGSPMAAGVPLASVEPASRHVDSASEPAPRTLRLRPATASHLRLAWLEAKRDDVLLTAQDFASNLVDEALAARKRRGKALRST